MIIKRIVGATRELGKSQGYLGLPVRDTLTNCTVNGIVPAMETAWEPTPEELARINAGQPIIVRIIGRNHPPIALTVQD